MVNSSLTIEKSAYDFLKAPRLIPEFPGYSREFSTQFSIHKNRVFIVFRY